MIVPPAPAATAAAPSGDGRSLPGGVAGGHALPMAAANASPALAPGLPTAAAVAARDGTWAALLAHPGLRPEPAAAAALEDGLARLAAALQPPAGHSRAGPGDLAVLVRRLAGLAVAAMPAAVASDRLLAQLVPAGATDAASRPAARAGPEAARGLARVLLAGTEPGGAGAAGLPLPDPATLAPGERQALAEAVRGEERRLLTELPLLGLLRSVADGLQPPAAWTGLPGWRAVAADDPGAVDPDRDRDGPDARPPCAAGHVRLALDLPGLGPVRAELALAAGRVTVRLAAGHAPSAIGLAGQLGDLRAALQALDLDADCAVQGADGG